MAEIPNSGFAMGYAHRETQEFVALDIGNLEIAADKDSNSISSPRAIFQKSLSRKGSLRVGGENKSPPAMDADAAALLHISGGAHGGERHAVSVHVACAEEPVAVSHVVAPAPAAGPTNKYRRLGSRRASAPWLDPRRVLFAFATLSSMGTLILLYFTLSMGQMSGDDADAR